MAQLAQFDWSNTEEEAEPHTRMAGDYLECKVHDVFHGYEMLLQIGEGEYSKVWLAEGSSGSRVALKVCRSVQGIDLMGLDYERRLLQFIAARRSAQPASVSRLVSLEDSFNQAGPTGLHLCMAFEVLGPQLLSLMEATGGATGGEVRGLVGIALDMLEGIRQLHDLLIVHTDLKPEATSPCPRPCLPPWTHAVHLPQRLQNVLLSHAAAQPAPSSPCYGTPRVELPADPVQATPSPRRSYGTPDTPAVLRPSAMRSPAPRRSGQVMPSPGLTSPPALRHPDGAMPSPAPKMLNTPACAAPETPPPLLPSMASLRPTRQTPLPSVPSYITSPQLACPAQVTHCLALLSSEALRGSVLHLLTEVAQSRLVLQQLGMDPALLPSGIPHSTFPLSPWTPGPGIPPPLPSPPSAPYAGMFQQVAERLKQPASTFHQLNLTSSGAVVKPPTGCGSPAICTPVKAEQQPIYSTPLGVDPLLATPTPDKAIISAKQDTNNQFFCKIADFGLSGPLSLQILLDRSDSAGT
eukprot:gene11696-2126_t